MTIKNIQLLRELTGAGMMDCKRALEVNNGNIEEAKKYLIAKFGDKAKNKSDRVANEGFIAHYSHPNGKIGSMVTLKCETDFVAKNDHFKQLAQDLAMHIAATNPVDQHVLLQETFVKDANITIQEYVNQTIGRIGENIVIGNFARFDI